MAKADTEEDQHQRRHLVITVHGIHTFGHWQERLEELLKAADPSIEVFNYKYGYFSVIGFIIPFFRLLVTRAFQHDMLREIRGQNWDRVDVVAHSFGTHLVAWGLYGVNADRRPKIHTIILAGSVLKAGFPWRDLVGTCANRVVNECGIHDRVLLLNQLFVLFTGMAGREGFSRMTGEKFRNRFFRFGHSGYFQLQGEHDDTFIKENWLCLLLSEERTRSVSDPRPVTALRGFTTFLFNNAEPIKLLL
jgi:WD40 repeat protein